MTPIKIPQIPSLNNERICKSFSIWFLAFALLFSSGCWFDEGIPVQVQRAVLHPRADSLKDAPRSSDPSNSSPVLFQGSGWVEPDPFEIRIPSLVDGVVDELLILEGETVYTGQIVARLIDDDAKLSLALAQSNLLQSQAKEKEIDAEIEMLQQNLYAAESFHKRQRALRDEHLDFVRRLQKLPKGAISQVDTNQSIIKLEGLNHLVQEAKFKKEEINKKKALLLAKKNTQKAKSFALEVGVETSLLDLNRTEIRSPSSGIVVKLLTSPGKRVMSNMDSPNASSVAVLFEKGKLQAGIDVPLADASNVFIGQEVEIICSFLPEKSISGKVTRISGEADFQRNTIEVKVQLLNPDDRLRPEMLCRAKFQAPKKSVNKQNSDEFLGVLIPLNLISNTEKKKHQLFIVSQDGETAEIAEVQLGDKIVGDHISVVSGLKGGEQIITNPPASLQSGDRVKLLIP